MKCKDVLWNVGTVVGCCVGVGFLSGKEAQAYIGAPWNVAVFGTVFAMVNLAVWQFCSKNGCFDVGSLLKSCFGRCAPLFNALFATCCFVCAVTTLCGAQSFVSRALPLNGRLPLWSMGCAGLAGVVLRGGIDLIKKLNTMSVLLALAYLVAVAATQSTNQWTDVPIWQPIKYALFSSTTLLSVTPQLCRDRTTNRAVALLSSAICCALVLAVLFAGDFAQPLPLWSDLPAVAALGCVCAVCVSVCGVAANLLPVVAEIADILQDRALSAACILCAAVAFSMFGFDFALRYGYLFVAIFGVALLCAMARANLAKRRLYNV